MEVFGNVDALKKSIEKKYSLKIKDVEKERDKHLAEIDRDIKKELNLLKSKMKNATDSEVKKMYSIVLSEEKLKSKKEFEEKRESLINSVFEEAKKKARKIAHSKEYLSYVDKNMPKGEKGLSIIGDSDFYKKEFPDLKIDENIIGLKFKSSELTYDFTLDNTINSKRDVLRHEISKILFG